MLDWLACLVCKPILNPDFNRMNRRIRCRSSCCDSHSVRFEKPFRTQVNRCLNVTHPLAVSAACRDQLTRVVAVRAADDNHNIAAPGEINGSLLPLFCWLTNCVHEAHIRLRKLLPDQLHKFPDTFNGLRRLRNDTEARSDAKFHHIFRREDDIKLGEIICHPDYFYVVVFADDDGMTTLGNKFCQCAMRDVNKRAGGFKHLQSASACLT